MTFWDIFKFFLPKRKEPEKLDIDSFRLLNPPVRQKHTHVLDDLTFERTGYIEYVHKAITTDQIASRVVRRIVEVQLSNGFKIFSMDREVDKKLRKRLEEIQLQTGERLYKIIHDLFFEFVAYGNQFAILVRDQNLASGKPYKFAGQQLQPIAAIFRQPARFVSIRRKQNGEPIEYRVALNEVSDLDQNEQLIAYSAGGVRNAYQQRFDRSDVVHFQYNPDPDLGGFGRPILLEQLDDLLVLRRLEGKLDDLIQRGKFFQKYYKVGSEDRPPTVNQVQAVKEKIEMSDPDEIMIVPQPDEVGIEFSDVITPIINAIKEFKNRAYSGLGQSGVQLGEAGQANRQTADTVIQGLYQTQRNLQRLFQATFEAQILSQIILDLGYNPQNLGDQMPRLQFEDPDFESVMRKNQHFALLFTQNVLTEDEMRQQLGLGPITEEQRQKLFANLYGQTKVNVSANQNIVQPQNQNGGGIPNA